MPRSPLGRARPRRRSARLAPAAVALLVVGALAAAAPAGATSAPAASTVPASTVPASTVPATAGAPTTSDGAAGARRGGVHDVSANLFEWNWPSVARECSTVLGPAGYGSVQVAPPQDSVKRTAVNGQETVLHPWWEVYQPVSYDLTSRMGTERQFADMVRTCRRAGVSVVVDTVVNHMTGQGSTSYGGRSFTKYDYPGLYSPADFHAYPGDCPVAPAAGGSDREGSIADFNDYRQVFDCELVGLSDLRTSSGHVQATEAAYLNRLLGYGVSGFRVDAAKHVGQADLAALQSRLRRTVDGREPAFYLEVVPGSPGRLSPTAFEGQGSLLGFDYATQLQAAFASYGGPPNDGNVGSLQVFGEESGLLPGDRELVFVENHDTERNGSTLNYQAASNTIAHEFMLAWPHGTPQVYSSFTWTTSDDSPPSDADGRITDTVCGTGAWTCLDRDPGVLGMVAFHDEVGDAPVAHWFDDGSNVIAFSRGRTGFFATNNSAAASTITVSTGMRAGTYCDVVHGSVRAGRCSGPTVVVDRAGRATLRVGSHDSVAFTASGRLR